MPLFVFISGMFSRINDREKIKKGLFRLLETYIIVQLIWKIPPILIQDVFTIDALINIISRPGFAMWYLLSLISWRLMVFLTPPIIVNRNPTAIIVLCISISLLGGLIPVGEEFSLQRTLSLLPFFTLGYYAREIDIKKYIAKIPLPLAVGVLLSLFFVYYFYLNRNIGLAFIWRAPYGTNAELPTIFHFLARSLFLVAATITAAMVMRVVPTSESLSQWGKLSLLIYIYHTFVVEGIRIAFKQGYIPQYEMILIIISIVVVAGLIILSRIKLFTNLMNPISYYRNFNGGKRSFV